ncbi:MAG: hypothetical protein ACKOAH_18910, partial [Pirellula sp.]
MTSATKPPPTSVIPTSSSGQVPLTSTNTHPQKTSHEKSHPPTPETNATSRRLFAFGADDR